VQPWVDVASERILTRGVTPTDERVRVDTGGCPDAVAAALRPRRCDVIERGVERQTSFPPWSSMLPARGVTSTLRDWNDVDSRRGKRRRFVPTYPGRSDAGTF
jgi:hypothetical protein